MDTTTIPQVAAGSIVESAGSLYEAGTNESISGSASTGTNYIKLVPGTDIVTPTWTTTTPTWSDAKQGWYGTGGSASHRYLQFKIELDSGNYYKKYALERKNIKSIVRARKTISSSTQNPIIFDTVDIDLNSEYNNSTGVFTAKTSGVYKVSCILNASDSATSGTSVNISLQKNGGYYYNFFSTFSSYTDFSKQYTDLVELNTNETIEFDGSVSGGGTTLFSGVLLVEQIK